jgi:hypothetical protein
MTKSDRLVAGLIFALAVGAAGEVLAASDAKNLDVQAVIATDIFATFIPAGLAGSLAMPLGWGRFATYIATALFCAPFLYIGKSAVGIDWILIDCQLGILLFSTLGDLAKAIREEI